jgi:hypothetical protein
MVETEGGFRPTGREPAIKSPVPRLDNAPVLGGDRRIVPELSPQQAPQLSESIIAAPAPDTVRLAEVRRAYDEWRPRQLTVEDLTALPGQRLNLLNVLGAMVQAALAQAQSL